VNISRLPFNVKLLANDASAIAGELAVENLDIFSSDNQFNSAGLYSSEIFGEVGTDKRLKSFGFIDMRTEIMHPKIFMELCKLKALYEGILSGRAYAVWDEKAKDFVGSNVIDGQTGYSFFMNKFLEIIHATNDSNLRELRIMLLDKSKDKCMYRYYQVIPAGLRDIELNTQERPKEDEINTIYRKLIRVSNTISIHNRKSNDPILDNPRGLLQTAANNIYAHLEAIFSGKRGWYLDKVIARNVHGSTRNVATAMDPSPVRVGSKEALTIDHTIIGLHQFMKGAVELTIHDIRKGPMRDVIEFMPSMAYVVDSKTLQRKTILPSRFTVDNWGTEEGIEKLINGFEKPYARHKPILVDGDYAALLYRDTKHYRVFYDITDLPNGFSKSNVKPITWAEMFYLSVYESAAKVGGYNTRYPVAGMGSCYCSKLFLETTVKSDSLIELDDKWNPTNKDITPIHMPQAGLAFLDSSSVHISKEPDLGLDHDGDTFSLPIVVSKEAIKEVDDYLNSPEAFLNESGGLRYGINNKISVMVLENFTRGYFPSSHGLESLNGTPEISPATKKDSDDLVKLAITMMEETPFLYLGWDSEDQMARHEKKQQKRFIESASGDMLYFTLKLKGKIIGFIRAAINSKKKSANFAVGVLKEYHGRGYGKMLVLYLIQVLKDKKVNTLTLSVDKNNTVALGLYQRLGFVVISDYTFEQTPMYRMSLDLTDYHSFGIESLFGDDAEDIEICGVADCTEVIDSNHYDIKGEITKAVHEAATSPLNTLDIPSEAMYKAGNYKKPLIDLHGLKIRIENPQGSVRSGTDADGNAWSNPIMHHYGYILGTDGADNDPLDVFIGEHPESQSVFIINQVDPKTREFDEHKVMLGFNSALSAEEGYLKNYELGWNGLDSIVETDIDGLKDLISINEFDDEITDNDLDDFGLESLGSGLLIRAATIDDKEVLKSMLIEEAIDSYLYEPDCLYLAFNNNELIGFIGCEVNPFNSKAVMSIGISESNLAQGVSLILVDTLVQSLMDRKVRHLITAIPSTSPDSLAQFEYLGFRIIKHDTINNLYALQLDIQKPTALTVSVNSSGCNYGLESLNSSEYYYHGSPKRNVLTLQPNPSRVLNGETAVFAGEYWTAIAYTRSWSDEDFIQGTINGAPYMKERYEGAFKKVYDGGGWVYAVSKSDFHHDPRLTNFEYISEHPVRIIGSEYIKDPIQKLKELGVKLQYYK
jgi:ribosomal protein S18 acetylase RimI-like enzyme